MKRPNASDSNERERVNGILDLLRSACHFVRNLCEFNSNFQDHTSSKQSKPAQNRAYEFKIRICQISNVRNVSKRT